jgi:hypothetical protein
MSSERTWLESLKIGDAVILTSRGPDRVERVEHATRTMVTVAKRRYRRSDGGEVGAEPWHWSNLREATGGRVEALRQKAERDAVIVEIRNAVEGVSRTKLPTESLRFILAALQPLVQEKQSGGAA